MKNFKRSMSMRLNLFLQRFERNLSKSASTEYSSVLKRVPILLKVAAVVVIYVYHIFFRFMQSSCFYFPCCFSCGWITIFSLTLIKFSSSSSLSSSVFLAAYSAFHALHVAALLEPNHQMSFHTW